MKNKISIKQIIILTVFLVFSAVILSVFVYERASSKNLFVNYSKRIAAESGAFLSGIIFDDSDFNNFSFGPDKGQDSDYEKLPLKAYLDRVFENKVFEYSEKNNFLLSDYAGKFQYENPENVKLVELRDNFKLKELVRHQKDGFGSIIKLAYWVKQEIKRGTPKDVDFNFNALDILRRAKNGEKFFCSEYATVFLQCALSLGYQARYVGLLKGHVVNEAWSDTHAKWFVVDVDNGIYYMKDGLPLDALELHEAFESKDLDDIGIYVTSDGAKKLHIDLLDLLSYYHEFYIRMRNDWFSNRFPHWHHRSNSIMNSLEWKDRYTRDNILISKNTSNKDELYFPINVVNLNADIKGSNGSNIRLILDTFTPGFSYFSLLIDGKKTDIIKDSVYMFNVHPGENLLEISSVNALGVMGPRLKVRFSLVE